MTSRYKNHFSCLLCILLLGGIPLPGTAQNTPNLSQTTPAGTATIIQDLPPIAVPSGKLNYERSYIPRLPMTNAAAVNNTASDVYTSTTYKDGFSRKMQVIVKNNTLDGQHLVLPVDSRFQKDQYTFLPYSVSGTASFKPYALAEQRSFYLNYYPGEGGASYGFSHKYSDAIDRMTQTFAPGKSQAGQGRGITVKQVTNGANEVRIWKLDANGLPLSTGYYAAQELFGERSSSSDGAESLIYKDKDGKIVYQRTYQNDVVSGGLAVTVYGITYYIYDELGQLRFIVPPKAASLDGLGSFNQTVLDNLCFQYRYDNKGLKIEQQLPGKAVEYFVYDKKQRLVFHQDGLLRGQNKWAFTIFDALDRPICGGVCESADTRQTVQGYIDDNITYQEPNLLYYQKNYQLYGVYPQQITNATPLTYTYYDDYSISDPAGALWNTYSSELQFSEIQNLPGSETPVRSNRVEGKVTGSRVKIQPSPNADPTMTGEWRETVPYYDDKGRVIYTVSTDKYQNDPVHIHYTGNQYDFANRLLINKHVLVNNKSTDGAYRRTELNRNIYDNLRNRLTQTRHKVDNGPWDITAIYTYDVLGRVKRKVLGNYGEVQDFDYNIRGQLSGINGTYAETGDRQGESRSFGEALKYDYGFTQPRYDGKIAGMIWRGSGNSLAMAYGYSYDREGRLTLADYRRYEPPDATYLSFAWRKDLSDYSVSNLSYDRNGNLTSMKQRGLNLSGLPDDIDRLKYTYESLGNKLIAVGDTVTANFGRGDFQDGNPGGTDYHYDPNGNLTDDKNKNIASVEYTYFNKPQRIAHGTEGYIEYSYDAAGNKVQELIYKAAEDSKEATDYIGNFVYKNNVIQYLQTSEGRTVYNKANQTFKEEFFVKDHLGNVRSTIDVYTYPTQEYIASYEVASANLENMFFEKVDEVRDDKPGSTWNGDVKSARLNGGDPSRVTGTSALLKVMAGDKVEMNVNNFYENYDPTRDEPLKAEELLKSIVTTLTGGGGGMPGESHDTKMVDRVFTSENYNLFNQVVQNNTDPSLPKASLNYILFDENMRIVEGASGNFQANGNGAWTQIGTTAPMTIPVNGYLAVYLNNGSKSSACYSCADVFFDQLTLRFSKGNLKEEAHYYPHGLPIAGMGSTANGFMDNRRKYQGNEYIKDLGLNWMDFNARQYDPQIGRFMSIDPLADAEGQQRWSPYAAMGNAPESMIDPNGESVFMAVGQDAVGMFKVLQSLETLFGRGTFHLDNGQIVFDDPEAAKVNFYNYALSGLGGGAAAADATMVEMGKKILAAQNDPMSNIQVGYATNGLELTFEGEMMANVDITATGQLVSRSQSVINNGMLQAGAMVLVSGGPENPVGDVAAATRITAAVAVAGVFWLQDHLKNSAIEETSMDTYSRYYSNEKVAEQKTADEILPGSLKRSPSYNPKYGKYTRSELAELAKGGDQIAGKMKKLVDQVDRLLEKNNKK